MTSFALVALLALCAGAAKTQGAPSSSWPSAAHDVMGQARSTTVRGPNSNTGVAALWAVPAYNPNLDGYSLFSDLIVSETGDLFYSASDDNVADRGVRALNSSGHRKWTYQRVGGNGGNDGTITNTLVLSNGTLYASTTATQVFYQGRNQLYALNSTNGTLVWSVELTTDSKLTEIMPSLSTPAVDEEEGVLYVTRAPTDDVFAFSIGGVLKWTFLSGISLPPDNYATRSSTPLLGAGLIFFLGFTGTLRALNKSTGALVWESNRINGFDGWLCVLGDTLMVGGIDNSSEIGLWAINAETGSERWRYADPAWAGLGAVYGGLRIGGLAADSSTGRVIATTGFGSSGSTTETALIPIGVYCVNVFDGSLIWHTKTSIEDTPLVSRNGLGSPSIDAEGIIYVPGCECNTGTSSTSANIYGITFCAYALAGNGTLLYFSSLPDIASSIASFSCRNRLLLASSGYLYTSTASYILALVTAPTTAPTTPASSSSAFSAAAVISASVTAACVLMAGLLYYLRKRSFVAPDSSSYRLVVGSTEPRYMATGVGPLV